MPASDMLLMGCGGGALAFPATGILDNFNRANEGPPPSASWTTDNDSLPNGLQVISNQCGSPAAQGMGAIWNTSFADNQDAYCTLKVLPTSAQSLELILRLQSAT